MNLVLKERARAVAQRTPLRLPVPNPGGSPQARPVSLKTLASYWGDVVALPGPFKYSCPSHSSLQLGLWMHGFLDQRFPELWWRIRDSLETDLLWRFEVAEWTDLFNQSFVSHFSFFFFFFLSFILDVIYWKIGLAAGRWFNTKELTPFSLFSP